MNKSFILIIVMVILTGCQRKHGTVSISQSKYPFASGLEHTLFLTPEGQVWSFGSNSYGQLGTGDTRTREEPFYVMSNISAIAAGDNHSLFLKTDGTLWGCGANNYNQINEEPEDTIMQPVKISSDVVAVDAAQGFTLFLKTDGSLWGCGNNKTGQLGRDPADNGDMGNQPVLIADKVSTFSAGTGNTLFITTDNTLWGCGDNEYSQLGLGKDQPSVITKPVILASDVVRVISGTGCTFIQKSNGNFYGCGSNRNSLLGLEESKDYQTFEHLTADISSVFTGSLSPDSEGEAVFLKKDGSLIFPSGTMKFFAETMEKFQRENPILSMGFGNSRLYIQTLSEEFFVLNTDNNPPAPPEPLPVEQWKIGSVNGSRLMGITASSEMVLADYKGEFLYTPAYLIDRDFSTSWCEADKSSGLGETVTLRFENPINLVGLDIVNGLASGNNMEKYGWNNRVRKLQISGIYRDIQWSEIADLKDDTPEWQTVNLKETRPVQEVTLTILEVYRGSACDDTCISEIRLLGPDGPLEIPNRERILSQGRADSLALLPPGSIEDWNAAYAMGISEALVDRHLDYICGQVRKQKEGSTGVMDIVKQLEFIEDKDPYVIIKILSDSRLDSLRDTPEFLQFLFDGYPREFNIYTSAPGSCAAGFDIKFKMDGTFDFYEVWEGGQWGDVTNENSSCSGRFAVRGDWTVAYYPQSDKTEDQTREDPENFMINTSVPSSPYVFYQKRINEDGKYYYSWFYSNGRQDNLAEYTGR